MSTRSPETGVAIWLKSTERQLRRAGDAKRVLLRRRFDAGIDRVWAACTDRDLLRQWFAEVDGELALGATLTLDVGAECKLTSRILHCAPPHRLLVTWSYPGRPVDEIELRLTPDPDGTLLELEHRSSDITEWWLGAGSGWEYAFIRLSVLLRGDDPASVRPEELDARLAPLWATVILSD